MNSNMLGLNGLSTGFPAQNGSTVHICQVSRFQCSHTFQYSCISERSDTLSTIYQFTSPTIPCMVQVEPKVQLQLSLDTRTKDVLNYPCSAIFLLTSVSNEAVASQLKET